MSEDKPADAAASGFGKEFARQFYPDAKACAIAAWYAGKKLIRKARRETFQSPREFLDALRARHVEDGTLVTLICKPSAFGPFLRYHLLPWSIGMHSNLRLGPPLAANHWAIAAIGQFTTHLSPVGLYPSVTDDVVQGCLYPTEANACGFTGLLPGMNGLVTSTPALIASRYRPYFLGPCALTGIVRTIGTSDFERLGFTSEDYEAANQRGSLWFLDSTTDESECIPQDSDKPAELWGGLYACGRLEIGSGTLPLDTVVEIFRSSLISENYQPQSIQNKARRADVTVYARGVRAMIDPGMRAYSIHMDTELYRNFEESRKRFDRISQTILRGIQEACESSSVDLRNPYDLDFSYTDSAESYQVLSSLEAEKLKDPLAVAIRDWHRRRNAV